MVSGLDPGRLSVDRERLQRLFAFLREFDRLRHLVREVAQLDFQLWLDELPQHESIERGWLDEEAEFVLRVARPRLSDCPEPPRVLNDWLEHGWQEPATEVLPQHEIRQPAPACARIGAMNGEGIAAVAPSRCGGAYCRGLFV